MCLILFSWQQIAGYPLILAANRDERYDRPTHPLHNWQEPSGIVGGRDLQAGGSWLAADYRGRFAAVTNVRDQGLVRDDARSRGGLITDFLTNDQPLDSWLERLRRTRDQYSGFNLLVGDLASRRLVFYSNQSNLLEQVTPGLYGLSNGELNEPWPKVERGKALLSECLQVAGPPNVANLLTLLSDAHQPDESQLPDTGVSLAAERALAPITIRGDLYGTCSSSVVLAQADGLIAMHEQDRRPQSNAGLVSKNWENPISIED